jgi:hypothetical protein
LIEGFIQRGTDVFPVGGGFGVGEELFHGLPFVFAAPARVAEMVESGVAHGAVQPAGERGVGGNFSRHVAGLAREVGENRLREVGGGRG